MRLAIIVASNRQDSILAFMEQWKIRDSDLYRLFVVEDGPRRSFPLPPCVTHRAHADIPPAIRPLVPVRTSGIKSLGIYLAFGQGYDAFLVLDDDCLPSFAYPTIESLIYAHLRALNRPARVEEIEGRCFLTMEEGYARGFPDSEKFGEPVPVRVSVGSWCGIPDIDGRTQEWHERRGVPMPAPKFRSALVGRGQAYVLSGMHLCFDRAAAPYMYFFPTKDRYFRYDDIWLGFVLKRLLDGLGFALIHSGDIFVLHARASVSARNKELEGMNDGYAVNDALYRAVRRTYAQGFRDVAEVLESIRVDLDMPYFDAVLREYGEWIALFTPAAAASVPATPARELLPA